MEIIPSIDLIDGRCVRLRQGKKEETTFYKVSPLDYTLWLAENGVKRLHIVDLNAAFHQTNMENIKAIYDIVNNSNLKVDVGGGIRTMDDIGRHLELGVSKVCLGTVSIKNRNMTLDALDEFGFDKIILCPDTKDKFVVAEGWTETSNMSIFDYVKSYYQYGQCEYICTDVDKDGMLSGASIELYSDIIKLGYEKLHLIASGGVSTIRDIEVLEDIGVQSVIVGKALFEEKIKINDLRQWLI